MDNLLPVVLPTCCGIDVHKKTVTACLLTTGASGAADATAGSYQLQALQLAAAQQSLSTGFANTTQQLVGAGTLTFSSGGQVATQTTLDVLNAQQQLFSTRRDLYQAQYNYLVSHLSLKAAAGSLDEADLSHVNQALH